MFVFAYTTKQRHEHKLLPATRTVTEDTEREVKISFAKQIAFNQTAY